MKTEKVNKCKVFLFLGDDHSFVFTICVSVDEFLRAVAYNALQLFVSIFVMWKAMDGGW